MKGSKKDEKRLRTGERSDAFGDQSSGRSAGGAGACNPAENTFGLARVESFIGDAPESGEKDGAQTDDMKISENCDRLAEGANQQILRNVQNNTEEKAVGKDGDGTAP